MGTRVRATHEGQVRALLRNREPEGAFAEIAAQTEIPQRQHEQAHASDRRA